MVEIVTVGQLDYMLARIAAHVWERGLRLGKLRPTFVFMETKS